MNKSMIFFGKDRIKFKTKIIFLCSIVVLVILLFFSYKNINKLSILEKHNSIEWVSSVDSVETKGLNIFWEGDIFSSFFEDGKLTLYSTGKFDELGNNIGYQDKE